MSLKSRKSIDQAGPDNHEEKIITFRKEKDGTFTKLTKTKIRDWKTGGVKSQNNLPIIEEGPFSLVAPDQDYDEVTAYEDFDGTTKRLYFKLIEAESEAS